ncbi:MAG TPA: hypothetical protein VI685_22440 [Candidatus Angelobacter sp.]
MAGLFALVVIVGCGGNAAKPVVGVPAGTYSVTVSANSGNTFGAVTVNVTVH